MVDAPSRERGGEHRHPRVVADDHRARDGVFELVDRLEENAAYWRKGLSEAGFDLRPGDSPIVPVMLYNAKLAQEFSRDLFQEGIYGVGFFFPVVPKGQARIRVQMSAVHERHHLEAAVKAFAQAGRELGLVQ